MNNNYQPPFDQAELTAKVFDSFESGKTRTETGALTPPTLQVIELVRSYVNWWVLMSTFPELDVICTHPIWLVRKVHASPGAVDRAQFVFLSISHLGRVPQPEDVLNPMTDNYSVLKTEQAIHQLFDDPGLAWEPLLQKAKEIKATGVVQL